MFLFNDNFLPPPQDVAADVFSHFNLDFNTVLLFTYFSNACRDDKLLELSVPGCLQEMELVCRTKGLVLQGSLKLIFLNLLRNLHR